MTDNDWRDLIQLSTPEARAKDSWANDLHAAMDFALTAAVKTSNDIADAILDAERRGREEMRDAAAAVVQKCREEGETDHRSMLYRIRDLPLDSAGEAKK